LKVDTMDLKLKYAGKVNAKLCPDCLKKGIETYITEDEAYCDYCLKNHQEKFKNKYPGKSPWYL